MAETLETAKYSSSVLAAFLARTVGTSCSEGTLVFSMPKQARRRFQGFITSPADHFPTSLTLHCPVQWHTL